MGRGAEANTTFVVKEKSTATKKVNGRQIVEPDLLQASHRPPQRQVSQLSSTILQQTALEKNAMRATALGVGPLLDTAEVGASIATLIVFGYLTV